MALLLTGVIGTFRMTVAGRNHTPCLLVVVICRGSHAGAASAKNRASAAVVVFCGSHASAAGANWSAHATTATSEMHNIPARP